MSRSTYILVSCFILILCGGFFSCNDDVKYSSSSAHRLSFSQDTIHFDTVFTTIGTSTRILKVFNKNNEHLEFSSVKLAGSEESSFRVNVSGHSGTSFTGLELRKRDSMYVFVDVKVDPANSDNPILIKDSLIFTMTNGVQQNVKLIAYGKDIYILRGKVIDRDTTFTAEKPIVIYDSLRVNEAATLTLEQGTGLYFHDKIYLNVHGTLKAKGTLEEPVLFRGDRLDWMFSNVAYDYLPGQWGGIRLYESSYDNHLNYVDIHGGEYGIVCDSSDIERYKLVLENSVIRNVSNDGIKLVSSKISVGNCEISNALRNCVSILGGDSQFIHCTIAGFYLDVKGYLRKTGAAAVAIYNENDKPVEKAHFFNCLITGTSDDELIGTARDSTISFGYGFTYSLVNTILDLKEGEDGYKELIEGHYPKVVWDDNKEINKAKNFINVDVKNYIYDFRLDALSAARGIASEENAIASGYWLDRYGRLRITEKGTDAGCYQWVPEDQPEE